MTDTTVAPWEPSAWMRGRMRERIDQAATAGLDPHQGPGEFVMALGRIVQPDLLQLFRPCDRCDKHVPMGEKWRPFTVAATDYLTLAGGLCDACYQREGGDL